MIRSVFEHQRRCKACSSIFYARPGHSDQYCETCGVWPTEKLQAQVDEQNAGEDEDGKPQS